MSCRISSRSRMNSGSAFTARASRVSTKRRPKSTLVAMRDASGRGRHDDELGGEEQRFLDAVRDEEEHLLRLPPQLEDQLLDLLARQRIERAERLVHQHHLGIARERAGEAHPLLHAAGELVDRMVARTSRGRPGAACPARPVRSAFSEPRIRRPKATFSATLSQGMSACFWNTTPRSAPGPVTGLPSRMISPAEYSMKPAMHEGALSCRSPRRRARRRNRPGRARG